MNNVTKRSGSKKIIIGLLLFTIVAGIFLHLYITRYLPPLIKERLTSIIVKGSDSLYRVSISEPDLDFWGGNVRFTDVHISADSNTYNERKLAGNLPTLTFSLHLPEAKMEGINVWAFLISKNIKIRDVTVNGAAVQLARHFRTSDTLQQIEEPLWRLIRPDINKIHIGSLRGDSLKLRYQNIDDDTSFHWQLGNGNLRASDIRVDSSAANDTLRLLYAGDVALELSNVEMKTPDGLYMLRADKINYSSRQQSLVLDTFNFIPAVSEKEFMSHFPYQHEIYNLKFPAITLSGFRLPVWIQYNRLQADSVFLNAPVIAIDLDRNYPSNRISKTGRYPQQLLQKAPFTITVNRLKATDARVEYSETNPVTQMTGKLTFSSLRATIDHITNDPVLILQNPDCVADISGRVMKTGSLHTIFRFNLADKSGAFSVYALITNLGADQLRPLFLAMTKVELQRFDLKKLEYSMDGDENRATANLRMQYSDLDILVNKVKDGHRLEDKGLLSFFVNRLAIYKENPMHDEEERRATHIYVQRDAMRSFFNHVWKTLYSSAGDVVLRPIGKKLAGKSKK